MSLRTRSSDDQLTTDGDTFKRRDEEALSSNVGRSSASPQCQPATVPKDNNLVRTYRSASPQALSCFTGRSHRFPLPLLAPDISVSFAV